MMLYDLLRLLSNNLVQHMWNIEALEAKTPASRCGS